MMEDALLKQLVAGDSVSDVWNHISGDAVTVVYEQGGHRRRMLIGVERKGSLRSGEFYRASTVLCQIGEIQKAWAAEGESPEKAVALVWENAQAELLSAVRNGVVVTPVFEIDPESPDGPHRVIWQHERDANP